MTAKRFTMCYEQNDINGWTMSIVDWETKEPFNYTTYEVHSSSITDTKDEMEDLCLLLNELNDENEQLRKQKARYKRLSEIRNEEINNRILTIKEFIDNCSNEKVKKALEDLFYSEVNEYDLSKKYRKLREENQELNQELHKIYELTTVNKVRDIVKNVYDDLLYETSDESDYARTKVLKCLEDIDNLRDDLE